VLAFFFTPPFLCLSLTLIRFIPLFLFCTKFPVFTNYLHTLYQIRGFFCLFLLQIPSYPPLFFHIFFCMLFSCYIIPFVVIVVSLFLFVLFFVFFCKWSEREQSRIVTSTMIGACGVELFIFYVWGTLLYTTLWWLVGFIPYFVLCFVV